MIYWVLKVTSQGTQKCPTTGCKKSKKNDDKLRMGQKLIFNTEKNQITSQLNKILCTVKKKLLIYILNCFSIT